MGERSEMVIVNILNSYEQTTINGIALLVSLIFDITDSNGNKFGDAFAYNDASGVKIYLHPAFRNTYKNLLGWALLNHIFVFAVGIRFLQDMINMMSGSVVPLNNIPSEILTFYNLCNQINNISNNNINNTNKINKIMQFYREIFNRKDEFNTLFFDARTSIPVVANILMRILYPPPAGAPAPTIVYFPPMASSTYTPPLVSNNSGPAQGRINNSGPPASYNSRPPATNTNSGAPATNTNSRAPPPPPMPNNSGPPQGVNIHRIIVDFANDTEGSGDMLLSMFNNRSRYSQTDINRVAAVLDNIYQITDSNGNNFGDAFTYNDASGVKIYLHPEFRNTYKNFLTNVLMNYLFFFIRGERFIEELTNGNTTIDSLEDEAQKDLYRLSAQINNDRGIILNFYREVFDRKDELLSYYDNTDVSNPIFTNILMRILYPPEAGAPSPPILYAPPAVADNSLPSVTNNSNRPPATNNSNRPPATNSNSAASRLSKIRSDLEYLTSLGLTANSDNETMKKTLRNYKNITQSDYVFPPASSPQDPVILRRELDKDLKYLFGLGLTKDSGNETMNDRLAKWKQLTGEDYVYNPSGGKYRRKILARKSVKRKTKGKSKTRKN